MKPVSIYKPVTVEQAIQILSLHGTEAGVYAGGTDLLIRLKNRLKQIVDGLKKRSARVFRSKGGRIDRDETTVWTRHAKGGELALQLTDLIAQNFSDVVAHLNKCFHGHFRKI